MTEYVQYLRVSTKKQGVSGLGLDAQLTAVGAFVASRGGVIVESFTEIESGKSHKNRPQLAAALALCRKTGATLVIAKLDRLARNVAFIANLMESKTEFVAVDFPDANRLTLHILAAVAEHERSMISTRIREALARSSKELGKNGKALAVQNRTRALEYAAAIRAKVEPGPTIKATAARLNAAGITTPTGRAWGHTTTQRLLSRMAALPPMAPAEPMGWPV